MPSRNFRRHLLHILVAMLPAGLAPCPATAQLTLSTASLSFVAVLGKDPPPQQFRVRADPAVSGFWPDVLAATQEGNWLTASAAIDGSFPGAVSVAATVKSAALPLGDYAGQITVSQAGVLGSPATVGVSLKVIPAVPYIQVTPSALSAYANQGLDPAPLGLTATNAGAGTLALSFSATASTVLNWLSLSQPIGGSLIAPASVQFSIHSAALAPGKYTGTITFTSPSALNSPLNVPVTLFVAGGTQIASCVSPPFLLFVGGLGVNPPSQNLKMCGRTFYDYQIWTTSGGNWLLASRGPSLSFGGWTIQESLIVSVNTTGLLKGTYKAAITLRGVTGGVVGPLVSVPVDLTVAEEDAKPLLLLGIPALVFNSPVGDFRMERYLPVLNQGTGLLKWAATANADAPTTWLNVSHTTSDTAYDGSIDVLMDASGLPAGVYHGQIAIASNAVSGDATQTANVVLTVGVIPPTINSGGVVNGASFVSKMVAPGAFVSIFGQMMGPKQGVQAGLVGGKLPTRLSDVQVLCSGTMGGRLVTVLAPLFYVSDTQLNVQVPNEFAGMGWVWMQVIVGETPSAPLLEILRAADPAVFMVNSQPGVFFANSTTQVTAQNPAKAGDILTLWATGLGAVETDVETGAPAATAVRARTTPKVTMGGVDAPVLYAGLAPGFVGVYQINIQVPAKVPVGNVSLIIFMGDSDSPPIVIPVQ